jgi:hypothetical protein
MLSRIPRNAKEKIAIAKNAFEGCSKPKNSVTKYLASAPIEKTRLKVARNNQGRANLSIILWFLTRNKIQSAMVIDPKMPR